MIPPKHQKVCFEESRSGEFLRDLLSQHGCKDVLFVTGKASYELSGAHSFVTKELSGLNAVYFSDFLPNPSVEDLERGLSFLKKVSPDYVIAVGGGSVLDMAKLMVFFGSINRAPRTYLSSPARLDSNSGAVPLCAIPTTAGTGSEATQFAVLYDGKIKHSVADPSILPDAVILNPSLTEGSSSYITACAGMDAFAQGVESFWAVGSTEESRGYAEKAIELSLKWLEKAVLNPDFESRMKMQRAAYWAGRSINISKTTASHAMSYALTAHYGVPHGHAVSLTLADVLLANAKVTENSCNDPRGAVYVRSVMERLFLLLGCADADGAAQVVRDLISGIGLTNSWMSERGVDAKDVVEKVAQEVSQERLSNNPCQIDETLLRAIVMHSCLHNMS